MLVQTVPFAGMAWAALTGRPDLELVRDVREALLQQDRFRDMLAAHERKALQRFRERGTRSYQRRHLYRTPLGPLGLPIGYDIWAIRVRTDVVEGEARTSFLARPGFVVSSNTSAFFSGQFDSKWLETTIRAIIRGALGLLRQASSQHTTSMLRSRT